MAVEHADLTRRQRLLSLAALYASIFSFSISFGGLIPLMALVLEGRGVDPALIGLLSSASPIGVLLAASLVPRVVGRFGTINTMIACSVVSVGSIALLPVLDSLGWWFALRLVSGAAGSGPWIITETWINVAATGRVRGRVIALYGAVMATGFAAGPIILTIVGTAGVWPFVFFTVLHGVSLVPILLARRLAPALGMEKRVPISGIVVAIPSLLAAAFLSGAVDMAFFNFLPIWGMRNGLSETFAVTLLSIFVAGNIVLQFPLGWLADVKGYRKVMIGCGIACVVGPVLAPHLLGSPFLLGAVLFVWGGCAWGVYTVALAALGARFQGGTLATANAAFVMAYELANIFGAPTAGAVLGIWERNGLMAFVGIAAAIFTILVVVRGATIDRSDDSQDA